ncbi:MAG: hypothetical protein V9F03_02095 [Microthrixaceae bacterium]
MSTSTARGHGANADAISDAIAVSASEGSNPLSDDVLRSDTAQLNEITVGWVCKFSRLDPVDLT